MKKKLIALTAGLASLGMLAAPAASAQDDSIAAVADSAGSFTTLLAALDAAGLAGTFADCSTGPFTVFAPTDDAFAAALSALNLTPEQLLADTATLTKVLQYHVLDGAVDAATAATLDGQSVPTLGGEEIMVTVSGSDIMINDAKVVQPDVAACNGVIHAIDAVLLPPSIASSDPATDQTTTTMAPADQAMPSTGNGSGQLALIATGLLGGGLMVLLVSRRRAAA